ncbi:hypothetical protein FA10DRAFT_84690 [Acaromyces ingoldii]|uniref:Uncharacterized protein n=1 Tax=Acaromyces ingoldii TaxID=215250 RepID=A0A316YTM3_9BASI|nr:hypothetical protein FA10DRAFT_84690 [Acaromyces ingoldii]PWN92124.1 hypothetical protein FA10DRAFT_84690 [Acaromyces ingoldii]
MTSFVSLLLPVIGCPGPPSSPLVPLSSLLRHCIALNRAAPCLSWRSPGVVARWPACSLFHIDFFLALHWGRGFTQDDEHVALTFLITFAALRTHIHNSSQTQSKTRRELRAKNPDELSAIASEGKRYSTTPISGCAPSSPLSSSTADCLASH